MRNIKRNYRCRTIVVTWLTLLMQFIWPLTLSFAPAISFAAQKAANERMAEQSVRTASYTLGVNETVFTVAKKYKMTVDELKKLNQFRSFAKPFTALTTGDELDVPAGHQITSKEIATPAAAAEAD